MQDSVELRSELSSVNVQLKKIGSGSYATVLKYKDPLYEKNFCCKRAKSNLNEKKLQDLFLSLKRWDNWSHHILLKFIDTIMIKWVLYGIYGYDFERFYQ